jgi:DNA-binding IclR family transcriptional regulator
MKPVRSVKRAISLLFVVARSEQPMGLTEISRQLGLDKATVLRLLATLEEAKLVQQDAITKRYIGGPALSQLSSSWRTDIRQIAGPYLRTLLRAVNESVCLVCPRDLERICIESLPSSSQELLVVPAVGTANPIYAGASGKVILAYLPGKEVDRIIELTGLRPVTTVGITERRMLLKHLETVRKRGYDYSISDVTLGASALAAPVFDANGELVACVTIRGPEIRMSEERMKQIAPMVKQTAEDISEELGHAPITAAAANT